MAKGKKSQRKSDNNRSKQSPAEETKPNSNNKTCKLKSSSSLQHHDQEKESSTPPILVDEEPKEQRKFKSRAIESNWEKYEEEPVIENANIVTDEQLKNTGADFLSLISNAGTNTSSFKFKDEADWNTIEEYENQAIASGKSDDLLCLNLEKIAKSLQNINTYKKLGLSSTLDSIKETGFEWHGDYLEKLKKMPSQHQQPELKQQKEARQLTSSSTGNWCFIGFEEHAKTVTNCLDKLKNESMESSRICESGVVIAEKDINEDSIRFSDQKSIAENQSKPDIVKPTETLSNESEIEPRKSYEAEEELTKSSEECEDELDFLLSMSEPQIGSHEKPSNPVTKNEEGVGFPTKPTSESQLEREDNQITDEKKDIDEHQTKVVNHVDVEGADLEDWLDSMLE